jgi:hypothetical protein
MRYCSISAESQIGGRDPAGLNNIRLLSARSRGARFVKAVGHFDDRKSWLLHRQDGRGLALPPLSWPQMSPETS